MTRIGVNLLWVVPGEVGGSEEYMVGLLRAYRQLDPEPPDVVLYVNRRFAREHRELCQSYPTVVAPIEGTSRPLRVIIESTWLARRSRRDLLDALHHAGGTMPVIRAVPGIVTLHDLQPITHPERFGLLKRTYIRSIAPRSLRAAIRVVCLARFTAEDAVEIAGVDPARVVLVPSGVDPVDSAPAVDPRSPVLEELGLTGTPFVLYPAITYAHKNHRTLLEAFARVLRTHPDLRLVLTGGVGPEEQQLSAQISRLGLRASVRRTGRIPAADLDALYRAATVMAFPSSYEGFGLPLLEAMARRCPVVASDVGGLAEVGGSAARLVDPFDVEAWVEALIMVLDDPGYRSRMVEEGIEQSHRYRWSDSAAALADLYRNIPQDLPPR